MLLTMRASCLLTISFTLLVSIELLTAIKLPACKRYNVHQTKDDCELFCGAPELCYETYDFEFDINCWRCPACNLPYRFFSSQTCDKNCKIACEHDTKCWFCNDLKVDCFLRPQTRPTRRRCELDGFGPNPCQQDNDGCWSQPPCHQQAVFYKMRYCSSDCGGIPCEKGPKGKGDGGYCWRCKSCEVGYKRESECHGKCDKASVCYLERDGCWRCPDCYDKNQWYTKEECNDKCTNSNKCYVTQDSSRRCWACLTHKPNPCSESGYVFLDDCRRDCSEGPNLCYRDKDECWKCPNCDLSYFYYSESQCKKYSQCPSGCVKERIDGNSNEKCWMCKNHMTTPNKAIGLEDKQRVLYCTIQATGLMFLIENVILK